MKDAKASPVDLRTRTRLYALTIIRLYAALPKTVVAQIIGKQLLRAGTSVGAHYRESIRAKSDADFISKVEGALQELEESAYWLELISEADILSPDEIKPIYAETNELIAILVTAVRNVKKKE